MRIISIELSGIKSISKKIKINFYRKTLSKNFDEKTAIKAIYGPNGSGKTGIISAMSLYRNIVIYKKSLDSEIIASSLKSLINKSKKELSISVVFANKVNDIIRRYNHEIVISVANGNPFIKYEKISTLSERYDETIKFATKNGEVVINEFKTIDVNNTLEDACKNVCLTTSFCSVFIGVASKSKDDDILEKYAPVTLTSLLCYSLSICFGSKNDSLFNNYLETYESDKIFKILFKKSLCQIMETKKFVVNHYEYIISKGEVGEFESFLKKMFEFIKVLKPELKSISKSNGIFDGECFRYRVNFAYEDYFVDLQYESTGIKKLVDLYETLVSATKGNIVLIDEFDAGLHDVVFERLIKYFCEDANCQLIFTTHNLYLLDYLKTRSNSIDFISNDNIVTTWVINGTASPITTFRNGGIPHIPFNFESYDFAGKF